MVCGGSDGAMLTNVCFMNSKSLRYFELAAINLFWIAAVFDPIGRCFGLRYVALVSIYFVLLLRVLKKNIDSKPKGVYLLLLFYIVFLIPFYGISMYFIRGGSGRFIDTSYIGSAILFGGSLAYLDEKLLAIGLSAQKLALRLMACVTIAWLIIYELGFPEYVFGHFVENGVAFFGPKRTYGNFDFYYIYFVASPMLVYLVVQEAWVCFDRKSRIDMLWCIVAVVALFLSGTRANMLMAISAVPFVYFWKKIGWRAVCVLAALIIIGFSAAIFFECNSIESMLSMENESNRIKFAFLSGYIDIFSDPLTLLFGQGFNAHVWSSDFANMLPGGAYGGASKTELTYLEFIRVFGVFMSGAALYLVFIFLRNLSGLGQSLRWMAPAVFLYMLVSALNPYLFSSNGMLPLGLCAAALQKYFLTNYRVGKINLDDSISAKS